MAPKLVLLLLAVSAAALVTAQEPETIPSEQPANESTDSFAYANGAALSWGGVCAKGRKQSPIDVPLAGLSSFSVVPQAVRASRANVGEGLKFSYSPSQLSAFDNGHTIELEGEGNNTAVLDDDTLTFLQMHLHSPSEHVIDGVRYAIEMHFVHRNERTQQLSVIGLLLDDTIRSADSYNSTDLMCSVLGSVAAANETAPAGSEQEVKVPLTACPGSDLSPVDALTDLLRELEVTPFAQYVGSLTTPPCSEGVQWTLFTRALHLEPGWRARFAALIHSEDAEGNARPTQPLYGRTIRYQRVAFSAHPMTI